MSKPSRSWPRIVHISYWTPYFLIRRPVAKKEQSRKSYHVNKERWIESLVLLQWFSKNLYLRSNNLLLKFIWFPKVFANANVTQRNVCSTWEPARNTIFTVTAILKVTVTTSIRERCEWDSGSESVLARKLPMRIQAGKQCSGSSLKRCQKLSSKHVSRDQLDLLEEHLQSIDRKTTLVLFQNAHINKMIWTVCVTWEINKSLGTLTKDLWFQWVSVILIINLWISSID